MYFSPQMQGICSRKIPEMTYTPSFLIRTFFFRDFVNSLRLRAAFDERRCYVPRSDDEARLLRRHIYITANFRCLWLLSIFRATGKVFGRGHRATRRYNRRNSRYVVCPIYIRDMNSVRRGASYSSSDGMTDILRTHRLRRARCSSDNGHRLSPCPTCLLPTLRKTAMPAALCLPLRCGQVAFLSLRALLYL